MADELELTWRDRVKVLMGQAGLNQRAVCRIARDEHSIPLSEFTMSEVMNGRMEPNSDVLAAICLVLRKRPSVLGFERNSRVEVGWRMVELELSRPPARVKVPA